MIYTEKFYLDWFITCAIRSKQKPKDIKKYNKTFQLRLLCVDTEEFKEEAETIFRRFNIPIKIAPRWKIMNGIGKTRYWLYVYYNEEDFQKVSIYLKLI